MSNKIALVTGGSRGIGKACALALAHQGYDVIINYAQSAEAAEQVVREIEQAGVRGEAFKVDVTQFAQCSDFIDEVVRKYSTIDVLINNAGITKDGLFMRMSEEDWNAVIHTNLTGVYNITKPVVRYMVKSKTGCIINISSISGVAGNAGQANYSAAKAGIIGLTKTLARELAGRNIRVNAIAPGFIETDMTKDLPKDKILENIPLNRLGQPDDVAQAVVFLTNYASFVTGQVLNVDGGMIM